MLRQMTIGLALGLALAGSGAAFAEGAKVPNTTEEHFALAKKYQDQAGLARKEAAEHRAMSEAAKQSAASSHTYKLGQKDPRVEKMQKHCAALVSAADKLAEENQKAADYHVLRGKELQGK